MDAPNNELMAGLATLLEAGKYSDLTIICGSKRYAVHRAIVCSRSGFFDGACSSPFRESVTGEIDLSEDDPEAVEHMIHYFYHLDYLPSPVSRRSSRPPSPTSPLSPSRGFRRKPRKLNLALVEDPLLATAATSMMSSRAGSSAPGDLISQMNKMDLSKIPPPAFEEGEAEINPFDVYVPEQESNPARPNLLAHCHVYALAEKYGIRGLKSLAQKKFSAQISHHWVSSELPDALIDVYETTVDTDRGLRDIVIQIFREHPELVRRKDVQAAIKDTPGLAYELFRVGWGMPIH